MLLSLVLGRRLISLRGILAGLTAFPACVFFLSGIGFMAVMTAIARRFDNSPKTNWTAQLVNTAAQLSFFLGLLLCLHRA